MPHLDDVLEATSGAWSDDKPPELKTAANVESYVKEKRQQYRNCRVAKTLLAMTSDGVFQ